MKNITFTVDTGKLSGNAQDELSSAVEETI